MNFVATSCTFFSCKFLSPSLFLYLVVQKIEISLKAKLCKQNGMSFNKPFKEGTLKRECMEHPRGHSCLCQHWQGTLACGPGIMWVPRISGIGFYLQQTTYSRCWNVIAKNHLRWGTFFGVVGKNWFSPISVPLAPTLTSSEGWPPCPKYFWTHSWLGKTSWRARCSHGPSQPGFS